MKKDYYKTLGISKDAGQEEIKQKYRKLARQWHPDMNPYNKKEAEEKFKELSEAYSVLMDPKKREVYDLGGSEEIYRRYSPRDIFTPDIFSDIEEILRGFDLTFHSSFFDFFGKRSGFQPFRPKTKSDVYLETYISVAEAEKGTKRKIKIPKWEECHFCKGKGNLEKRIEKIEHGFRQFIILCSKCNGTGFIKDEKRKRSIEIKIPSHTYNLTLRFRGLGRPKKDGTFGDIYLEVKIKD